MTAAPRRILILTRGILIIGPGDTEAIMVYCPECETNLDVDEEEVDEGEIISCPECGTDFEIVTVSPIELKPVEDAVIDEEELEEMGDGDDS